MTAVTIDDLQGERARLALAAADGIPGAAEELAEVEGAIKDAALDAERATLADGERSRREAAEAQARASAAKAEAERQLRDEARRAITVMDETEQALATLVTKVNEYKAVGDRMRELGQAAGVPVSDLSFGQLGQHILQTVAQPFPALRLNVGIVTSPGWAARRRRSLEALAGDPLPPVEPTDAEPTDAESAIPGQTRSDLAPAATAVGSVAASSAAQPSIDRAD